MLLVIDTNILVNALMSSNENSKAMQLLDDVFAGKHTMVVSSMIMEEYADVLNRPHLGIPKEEVVYLLEWIDKFAIHIEPLPTTQWEVEMRDEDDRVFFDTAKCLNARLVTRNYKHYPVHELVTLIDELY